MTLKRPFIYDRPVCGDEFVNREVELRTIFNDLHHGVSTVISGEPRIGKTSLLLQVANETIQRDYLGAEIHQFIFVFLNLNFLVHSHDYTPSMLWEEVLRRACLGDIGEQAANANYSHWSLESLFEHLGNKGGGWFSF